MDPISGSREFPKKCIVGTLAGHYSGKNEVFRLRQRSDGGMASGRSGDLPRQLQALFQIGTLGGLSDAQLLERFVAGRDEAGEAAFRALVDRHGPMVLRVCRSVLHDEHDAEDAFQVTFLVLARKAGSIRKQKSIGSWLHGVAHRVALKARTAARRRRAHESRAAEVVAMSGETAGDALDLSPVLHEEIARLPAKYRAPIVLCYLEGMTQDQAARELDWPVGTVRGRIARARDLLRTRLTRRGLALSAGIAAVDSLGETASAAIPAALREATIQAVLGSAAAGALSRTATLLLQAVLKKMAVTRFIQWAAPLLLIALVASGAVVFVYPGRMKLSGERTPIAKIQPVRPPAPTDLLGDPLPDGALARLGSTRFLHEYFVSQVRYSPDGATLASSDGALHLWDPATGRLRQHVETGAGRGSGHVPFAYAPDGRSMAVQSDSGTSLYDASTGRLIRRFAGKGPPYCLAFSTDGQILAAAHHDDKNKHVITLWDVASGRVSRRIACPPLAMALAFLPDGKALVSAAFEQRQERPRPGRRTPRGPQTEESAIHLWEVATGKEICRIAMGNTRVNHAVLAPDGKTLATAATDKTIRLWDLATGQEIRRFGTGEAEPRSLAFSRDGTKLAATEAVGPDFPTPGESLPMTAPIQVWDTATGRERGRWETDNGSLACAFSPDCTTLATAGGHVLRLWDVASHREIEPQSGHRSSIRDTAFAPDGRSIVTVGEDRTIRFWDPASGREIRQLEKSGDGLGFASFSADGKALATGYGVEPTRLWDVASGRELRRFQLPGKIDDRFVSCAELAPDGKTLAASANDGLIFWDTATGTRRAGVAQSRIGPALVKALRFAPDGKSVATVGGDWVRIWDVATAKETRRIALANKGPIDGFSTLGAQLAYSPDSRIVAASSTRDGVIFLLDVASGRELGRLDGPKNHQKALAFSPDGTILATGVDVNPGLPQRELAIRLWDVAARKEIGRIPAHRSSITALAYSPDGRRLVSASEDATALVWDVARIKGRGTVAAPSRGSIVRGN
jgi:RNA polymerase sigma factor (sigma-70 family)